MTASTVGYRAGTYRASDPEVTWQRVVPLLDRFGITRVADITDLDEIGLPVHVAYRPAGSTVAASVGTGLTVAQSRVSAVMESIELWHAENPRLDIDTRAPAGALALPYDVRMLNLADRSPLTDRVVLDWVTGRGLLTGAAVPVPADAIALDFTRSGWATALFRPTTNGLATGSSPADATLHAILELAERDCVSDMIGRARPAYPRIDPRRSAHPAVAAVHRALRSAGCQTEVRDITNRLGLPCFSARIWSADVPIVCGGYGCHVDAALALSRAMAEAAQSRLAAVSGARDDIDEQEYQPSGPLDGPGTVHPHGAPTGAPDLTAVTGGDLDDVVRHCARRIAAVTGCEPFVVDLTRADVGIPVSKVFAPGLRLHTDLGYRFDAGDRDE